MDGLYAQCSTEVACSSATVNYEVDYQSIDSLHNWIEQMDLYCVSEVQLGSLGSSFMAGCFFGSFILPRAADIIGRKPMFVTGLVIFICVVTASLFCRNLYLAYFLLFMGGISETGRYYVAYVYLVEFMPQRYQNNAGLYIFMVFGFIMTYIAL